LNGLATGLYIMSWLDCRRGRHRRGIAISALGYGITVGAGYMGGALVFDSGIGVDCAVDAVTATTGERQLGPVDGCMRSLEFASKKFKVIIAFIGFSKSALR
jgi:hypothetical protein